MAGFAPLSLILYLKLMTGIRRRGRRGLGRTERLRRSIARLLGRKRPATEITGRALEQEDVHMRRREPCPTKLNRAQRILRSNADDATLPIPTRMSFETGLY